LRNVFFYFLNPVYNERPLYFLLPAFLLVVISLQQANLTSL